MKINKFSKNYMILLQFIVLFIIGWVTSLLIGNIIITISTCFLVSIMFNWKKIERARNKKKIGQPTQQNNCSQCGAKLLSNSQFCHSCGAQITSTPVSPSLPSSKYYTQQEIWDTYKTIKENYEKGKIDSQTYSWFFSGIILVDNKGNYWSISGDSLNWFQSQDGNWVPGQPIGNLRIIQKVNLGLI